MPNDVKRGKLEQNKKAKKEALLSTAFELFTSKGINKTSISDIVQKAGVAKGTFYLYFTDKYDIRNRLISHKASQLFHNANEALLAEGLVHFEDQIIFLADSIIGQLNADKSLLTFISKNLSWGVFKSALTSPSDEEEIDFYEAYMEMLERSGRKFENPELMLFLIVELISSTCHSSILYGEPVEIGQLKPHLYSIIRKIIESYEASPQP